MRLHAWVAIAGLAAVVTAHAAETVEVYKSPSCGCCGSWVEYLKQNGFAVKVQEVADVGAARKQLGMPQQYAACHTAKVGGYVVEGHVPADDIKKLLAEKPQAVGIAVPSMPPGSPGMPSAKPIAYDTLLVQRDGTYKVFSHH